MAGDLRSGGFESTKGGYLAITSDREMQYSAVNKVRRDIDNGNEIGVPKLYHY